MADNIQDVNIPDAGQAELAQQMAMALGTPAPATTEPAATTEPVVSAPVDSFSVFKEKFGWEAPEAAIQEIEQLRAFKATSPVAETLKFENPESEKLARAIQAGNFKEVHSILDQQIRIDSMMEVELNDISAADMIKLNMALKYKDLTPQEIDYKFKKQYGTPAKPAMTPGEDQEDYQERLNQWQAVADDKKMEMMIDAKLAKPELQASKSKIVLPEINQPVDDEYQEYLQWKKSVEDTASARAETADAYKAFTPKSVETRLNFNDEANKVAFEFQHEPDAASFAKTIEYASDTDKFWSLFHGPDGKPDRQKFIRAIHFALNQDQIVTDAINQAKNATIKAMLPDNSQAGGLIRQMVTPPGEPDPMQEAMARAGIQRR